MITIYDLNQQKYQWYICTRPLSHKSSLLYMVSVDRPATICYLSADTCTLLRNFDRRFDLLPFSDPSRSNSTRNNRDTNSKRLEVLILFKGFSATHGINMLQYQI